MKWNEEWNKIYMRSGSRPSPEGTRLLFAGGTVSPMMCPADGQQKDDKKGQTEDKPRWGRRQPKKTRVDRNEVVVFRWIWIYLVFWGDPVCVISHDISRYIVILCPVSCDITRYGILIYRIHIPNFWDWYRDIVSRRNSSRYRTLFVAS